MYAPSACNFMSRTGVRAALQRCGFRIERLRTDRQQPTLAKLAGHLHLRRSQAWLARRGWIMRQLPVAMPIPGVVVVDATPQ